MSDGVEFDEALVARMEQLYQTASMTRRRRWIRDKLDLAGDEHILSIGTGPGFESRELAEALGNTGRVHGIDTAGPMLAAASERCAEHPSATFEQGDATALPIEENTFDIATAVQVYEYVPDLDTAFAELSRVLKPGGRALVFDSDWSTLTYHTADTERSDRVIAAFDAHCPHPRLARTLKPRLDATNFTILDQDVFVHFETERRDNGLGPALLPAIREVVTTAGGMDDAEVDAWVDDIHERADAGEFFFTLNQYAFIAETPLDDP